ncbi:MAG TPA: hypothetical protein VJ549_07135 [Geothrix sp.]|nr:hypothetical protein [Geothrix sp.]
MNRRFRKPSHDHRSTGPADLPLHAPTLEMLDLKVPRAVVETRIREREPHIAQTHARAALIISIILALVLGFLAWELSGLRLALVLVGCTLPFVPLATHAARRDATRISARWRALPWDHCVSFICKEYGLVHMSPEALAMEWHVKPNDGGVIWKPRWIGGVTYEPDRHLIRVETIKVYGAHSSSWQERYWFGLPGEVEAGQGQVIADIFHMLWAHEARQPTPAARAWLADQS